MPRYKVMPLDEAVAFKGGEHYKKYKKKYYVQYYCIIDAVLKEVVCDDMYNDVDSDDLANRLNTAVDKERDYICNELNRGLGLLRKMWTIGEITDFIKRIK